MSDDPLVALALRLTDGELIDWKAESESGSVDLALLQILKQIEAVARAHEGADTPIEANVAPTAVRGPLWGHLQIIELIGSGSYGDVYRARDTRLGRDVALKLLRTRAAAKSDSTSLIREGHLLSRVRHPNVVTVYGADCVNGQTGLWMELIEGETLEQEVQRRGAFQADEVAIIGAVLCDALEAVHSAGLLHRDVKTQNVMRERDGRLVLMDFGSGHDAERFAGGTVEGTPLYAAPEVLNGAQASVQSDIYSLGVVLWYLLTGNYPVNGLSVDEIRRAHALGRVATLESQGANAGIVRIAGDCLAINPRNRPCRAVDIASRLRQHRPPAISRGRSIRNWSALGAFAAAVLLLAVAPLRLPSTPDAGPFSTADGPVWSSEAGAVLSGAPTADGQYFACSSIDAPVAVCNVTTGIMQRVAVAKQSGLGVGEKPLISPDRHRVAYIGLIADEVDVVDLLTSATTSIRRPLGNTARLIAWRDSGDSLLIVLGSIEDAGLRLRWTVALLEVTTGTFSDLKRFDVEPNDVALSHDGRYLAFRQRDDLYVADLLSGETHHILAASGIHGALIWMPQDDGLLFIDGTNGWEIRLVRLFNGERVGKLEALQASNRSAYSLLGMAANGNLYYRGTDKQPLTLHIAPFSAALQQLVAPTPIATLQSVYGMDWSPDSDSIAYARRGAMNSVPTIVVRNVQTSQERQIELSQSTEFQSEAEKNIFCLRWSREAGILATGAIHDYLVNPNDMSMKLALTWDRRWVAFEWTPDGSTALFRSQKILYRVNVSNGTVIGSHTIPTFVALPVVSPEQKLVAYSGRVDGSFEVNLVAFDEDTPRTLLSSDRSCEPVGWWKRQVIVACNQNSELHVSSSLYLVDVDSTSMKSLGVDVQNVRQVRVRPDDQAVAIIPGRSKSGTFVLKIPPTAWGSPKSTLRH